MASNDSIRRAILRPGHFLSLHSDRQLYVSPVRSLDGFSVFTNWGTKKGSPHSFQTLGGI